MNGPPRASGERATEGLRIDRRKGLLAVTFALLLAGAAFAALGQVAQFGKLGSVIANAQKVWLPVCLMGQLLAYLGYMLAYRDVARASGGPCFEWLTTARIVIFGTGVSVLGASVGGLAVDFWALRRTGSKTHVAARRVLAVGTIEWTVLSLYACSAAAVLVISGATAPLAMALAWLIAVPACVAGALWFTAPQRVQRFVELPRLEAPTGGPIARTAGWVRDRCRIGLADAISGVVLVRHLLSHPVRYRGGALGYPIYWAGDMLTLYAAVRAFGGHPNVVGLILAYASAYVISALPLPAGGAGGIEAAMAVALHAVGVALAPALLAVFLYRIVTFWLPVVPALLLLPAVQRLNDALPAVPHTSPDPDETISFRPRQDVARGSQADRLAPGPSRPSRERQ